MPALVSKMDWPPLAPGGGATGTPRLGRAARITAHLLGWPLLVKLGLLLGFALTAAVQTVLAA